MRRKTRRSAGRRVAASYCSTSSTSNAVEAPYLPASCARRLLAKRSAVPVWVPNRMVQRCRLSAWTCTTAADPFAAGAPPALAAGAELEGVRRITTNTTARPSTAAVIAARGSASSPPGSVMSALVLLLLLMAALCECVWSTPPPQQVWARNGGSRASRSRQMRSRSLHRALRAPTIAPAIPQGAWALPRPALQRGGEFGGCNGCSRCSSGARAGARPHLLPDPLPVPLSLPGCAGAAAAAPPPPPPPPPPAQSPAHPTPRPQTASLPRWLCTCTTARRGGGPWSFVPTPSTRRWTWQT